MSEEAKKARAAMKAKAQRLGGADRPLEKVDSSSWTPPEMLNANVKTGLRPVSRRAYKAGGKVEGAAAKARADRPKRKNGGSALTADSLINRNVKSANAEREGAGKHVGGFKKGGRAEKCGGGEMKRSKHATDGRVPTPPVMPESIRRSRQAEAQRTEALPGDDITTSTGARPEYRKAGGRTKKFLGGPMLQPGGMLMGNPSASMSGGPSGMPAGAGMPGTLPAPVDPRLGIVPKNAMSFGMGSSGSPYKKGGAVKHPDEAADKSLIKKMVKGTALKRKEGGKVFSGEGYPHKVPGAVGGRSAHASGGAAKTKGKTQINVIVAAGRGAQQPQVGPAGIMPPQPMPPAGGRPVTVPPPAPAGAAPMPMPIPIPMGGAGAPTGAPPMARKAGGRITKTAHSYKDMEAGAGSGEGRLQKTEIAKRSMHNKGGKVGHRNYRNYEDMDAGAGSGLGRLEKTEIARKGTGIQKAS